jgi:putative phosphoribosyl transferase
MDALHVAVVAGGVTLAGELTVPPRALAVAVFAHRSGAGRHSPRSHQVAEAVRRAGLGTLLFDLLTEPEQNYDAFTARLRYDIRLLSNRLVGATDWLLRRRDTAHVRVGYFGTSTGAAAALCAAARRPAVIGAVVARGGRPDLARGVLAQVVAPTLLIVGARDPRGTVLSRDALEVLPASSALSVVAGATERFEEPGAIDEVARRAAEWLRRYLVDTHRAATL